MVLEEVSGCTLAIEVLGNGYPDLILNLLGVSLSKGSMT
jgi:hypothetical protein